MPEANMRAPRASDRVSWRGADILYIWDDGFTVLVAGDVWG